MNQRPNSGYGYPHNSYHNNPYQGSQLPPSSASSTTSTQSTLEQLQVTLVELDKAMKNVELMAQTARQLGLFSKDGKMKSINLNQIIKHLKQNVDIKQIQTLLESPAIRQMLTDPEFYQLFAPDTGTTPGSAQSTQQSPVQPAPNQNPHVTPGQQGPQPPYR